MTSKLVSLILCAAAYLFMNSCDMPECRNSNPIFDNFSPDAKEYRSELAKHISHIGAKNLSYWHDKYVKKGGAEYIVVYIQGKDLCAKGEIQVSDWGKISGMRREVSGYHGAKLQGLDFEVILDSTETNFLFKDTDRVID
jgi:hypothetical protein